MTMYYFCAVLFVLGIYCIALKQDLFKIIIGLMIMEYAVILFLVTLGYKGVLIISAAGLAISITMTAIALRIYQRYGTFDITKMRKLKG